LAIYTPDRTAEQPSRKGAIAKQHKTTTDRDLSTTHANEKSSCHKCALLFCGKHIPVGYTSPTKAIHSALDHCGHLT